MKASHIKMIRKILIYTSSILVFIFCAFPIYWIFLSSVKPVGEILSYPPTLIPTKITFENYQRAFFQTKIIRWTLNSFILSLSTTLLLIPITVPASYALARFEFPGKKYFLTFLLVLMSMPPVLFMLPYFVIIKALGLLNTYIGLILVYLSGGGAMNIWLLKTYFESIPRELDEAALIDGCSRKDVIIKIILPLSGPGLITSSLFSFIGVWNDFSNALILTTSDDMRPVMVGVYHCIGQYQIEWGMLNAMSFFANLPPIILFLLLQRYYIAGLARGALKG